MLRSLLRRPRVDEADMPVHQPLAWEAPIPGTHWYSGCDEDRPRVGPDGVCLGCGEVACPVCGREDCREHPQPEPRDRLIVGRELVLDIRDGVVSVLPRSRRKK